MEDTLRKRSGEVNYHDPLTSFMYDLLKNCGAGTMERLVQAAEEAQDKDEFVFTNGWLAHYANDLAIRLRKALKEDV